MKAIARAHTNVALIKYWGKRDETLMLPANSSLSLTVDQFYTTTALEWDESLQKDSFVLNGKEVEDAKVSRFLSIMRQQFQLTSFARISSENHVPTAAGLASSASAFAALALAGSAAAGRNDDRKYLSKLARLGSGSASRSLYGDLVIWEKGNRDDGEDSFGVPFTSELTKDLAIVVAVVSDEVKKVPSRLGMQSTVETSPFFPAWVQEAEKDLVAMKDAFAAADFIRIGEITEHNAMKMHATTLGANPPFTYFQPKSLQVMDKVRELRLQGIAAYFTMDAGPNVKVLCERKNEKLVASELTKVVKDVFICHAGEEASVRIDEA